MRSIQEKSPVIKTRKSSSIQPAFVEVVLGRPGAKCKHFGICKIESIYANGLNQDEATSCPSSNRLFSVATHKSGVYFELAFERTSIPDSIFERHFQSGIFKIEEAYTANLEISSSPILIPIGEYKIDFSDTFLRVRFPVE